MPLRGRTISRYRFKLPATLLVLLSCTVGYSQTCDFTYVAQELPLLAETEDLTDKVLTEENWGVLRSALPNVKMVFATPSDPFFSVGLGWAELPENYSSLSREQATERLRQMLELGSWQQELEGHTFEYDLLSDDPVSATFVLDHPRMIPVDKFDGDFALLFVLGSWCSGSGFLLRCGGAFLFHRHSNQL